MEGEKRERKGGYIWIGLQARHTATPSHMFGLWMNNG